jgi:hypothetical protein
MPTRATLAALATVKPARGGLAAPTSSSGLGGAFCALAGFFDQGDAAPALSAHCRGDKLRARL